MLPKRPEPGLARRMLKRGLGRLWRHFALLVVLAVSLTAIRWGHEHESPTTDEWAHFVRGVAYWQTGDSRLSFAHPPFANLLATAPAVLGGELPRVADTDNWEQTVDPGRTSVELLQSAYARMRAGLTEARKVTGWVLLLGVVYIYSFVMGVAGRWPALLASAMVAWNPVVVAQARYATTDLPAAVTIAIAVGELVRFVAGSRDTKCARPYWPTLRLALAVTVALATKHSAVILVLLVPATVAATAALGRGVFAGMRGRVAVGWAVRRILAVALLVVVGLNLAYGFQRTGDRVDATLERPEPQYWVSAPYEGSLLEDRSPLGVLPRFFRIPLPYTYVFGVACVTEQMRVGYPYGVFLGRPNRFGHPLYFPLLFVVKTPLWILALMGTAVVGLVTFRRRLSFATWVTVAISAVLCGIVVASRLNMGIRHALPQLFLLTMSTALLLRWPIARLAASARVRLQGLSAGVLALWAVATLLAAGPRYLGSFNALVSRSEGVQISPVGDDWGQDVAALAEVVNERGLAPFFYFDSGRTRRYELEHWGTSFKTIGCDARFRARRDTTIYIAVHVHDLQRRGARCLRWREDVRDTEVINDHIVLHRVHIERTVPTPHDLWQQLLRGRRR